MTEKPIVEYAKGIYEVWDNKGVKPPKGYSCWMDVLSYHEELARKDRETLKSLRAKGL